MSDKYKGLTNFLVSMIVLYLTCFYFDKLANFLMPFTSHKFDSEAVMLSFDDYAKNFNIVLHGGLGIFALLFLSSLKHFLLHLAHAKKKTLKFCRLAIIILKAIVIFVCIGIVFRNLKGEIVSILSYSTIYQCIGGFSGILICVLCDFLGKSKNLNDNSHQTS